MPHKADTTVICQCGAMVCKYYMPKHLRTTKHERDMVGIHTYILNTFFGIYTYICIHIYIYVCICMYMYVCMYVCVHIYMICICMFVCVWVCVCVCVLIKRLNGNTARIQARLH
jgi:hypothetical protein